MSSCIRVRRYSSFSLSGCSAVPDTVIFDRTEPERSKPVSDRQSLLEYHTEPPEQQDQVIPVANQSTEEQPIRVFTELPVLMYAVFETYPLNQQATKWSGPDYGLAVESWRLLTIQYPGKTFLVMDKPYCEDEIDPAALENGTYMLSLADPLEPITIIGKHPAPFLKAVAIP